MKKYKGAFNVSTKVCGLQYSRDKQQYFYIIHLRRRIVFDQRLLAFED